MKKKVKNYSFLVNLCVYMLLLCSFGPPTFLVTSSSKTR